MDQDGESRECSKTLEFKVRPHTMRYTFAANIAEKKMPQNKFQELMEYMNINSTRIYPRLLNDARKKMNDQYHS